MKSPFLVDVPPLRFEVPGRPVPQPRPRVVRGGAFEPKAATEWKARVATYARLAVQQRKLAGAPWPIEGSMWVVLEVRRARRAGDVDNHAKGVLDALNGIAWNDDAQVMGLHAQLVDGMEPGCVVLVSRAALGVIVYPEEGPCS